MLPLVTTLMQSEVVRPFRKTEVLQAGFCSDELAAIFQMLPSAPGCCPALQVLLHVSGTNHIHRKYRQELFVCPNTLITGDIS